MPRPIYRTFAALLFVSANLVGNSLNAQQPSPKHAAKAAPQTEENPLAHEIRHQLFVLPFYSVFDYIAFSLNAGKVTLTGYVLRPTLRADAEAAVRSIEGVNAVNNQIEILPKSVAEDDLRRSVYRAIYEDSTLQRYAVSEVPAIHIIVKDAFITLEGTVATESDKNLAATRASGVSGVTGVKNNLAIHSKGASPN